MTPEFKARWDAAIKALAVLVAEDMVRTADEMNKEAIGSSDDDPVVSPEGLLENYEESEMEDPFEINKDVIAQATLLLKGGT